MIGSEKTAGRRQAGKIKKPADFSTEGKTAGRSLGAVPPGFVPKRHALIFRNGERRCRLKKFGGTARRRLSPFSAAAFAPDGCSLGVGGNGYSSASKRFLLSRLFYRRGGGFVKVGRRIFAGNLRRVRRSGGSPFRRPQAGERGAPAGGAPKAGAPKAGEARQAAARSGICTGFNGRGGCVLPYLRPAVRHGLPGHFGRWPAAGLPHRGSGAPGAGNCTG